jgi:hypothetical protein
MWRKLLSLLFRQFIADILVHFLADLKNSQLTSQNLQNLLNTSFDICQRQNRHFVIPSSFKGYETQIRELSRVTPVGTGNVPLKSQDWGCLLQSRTSGTELSNKITGRILKLSKKWGRRDRKRLIGEMGHKRLDVRILLRNPIDSETRNPCSQPMLPKGKNTFNDENESRGAI